MADQIERVSALLVIGAPGSGKTALIKEISECLYRAGEHHTVIDLDELCRGVLPGADDDFLIDLAVENLTTVWGNFRRRGARRLVMARVVRSSAALDAIISAVPDCEVTVCRLSVGAETVQSRLRQREAGSSFDFLASITATVAGGDRRTRHRRPHVRERAPDDHRRTRRSTPHDRRMAEPHRVSLTRDNCIRSRGRG